MNCSRMRRAETETVVPDCGSLRGGGQAGPVRAMGLRKGRSGTARASRGVAGKPVRVAGWLRRSRRSADLFGVAVRRLFDGGLGARQTDRESQTRPGKHNCPVSRPLRSLVIFPCIPVPSVAGEANFASWLMTACDPHSLKGTGTGASAANVWPLLRVASRSLVF